MSTKAPPGQGPATKRRFGGLLTPPPHQSTCQVNSRRPRPPPPQKKIVKRGFLGSGCCVLSCLLQFSFFNTVSHLFLTLVSSFVFYFPSQPSEFIIWVSASFSSKRCLIQFSIFNFRFGISHVFTHAPAPAVNKKYVIAPLTFLFFFHLLFHDFVNLSPSFVFSRLVSKFNRALFGRFILKSRS